MSLILQARKAWSPGRWLVLSALLVFPLVTRAQNWNWTAENVDAEGASTSIVADRDGNLHLSYYVANGGQVKYGFRPAGSSKWFTMPLEHSLGVLETHITVDSDSNPHVCYTPRAMKYAHWSGHRWLIQEVDPGSGLIAYMCSIQVTPDGKPMLSWYLESTTYLRYAILQDGVWSARTIEGGDSLAGKWTSMALDANGFPRISFSEFLPRLSERAIPPGLLKFAWYDGKKWSTDIVDIADSTPDSGGDRGMGNSLVLDSKGEPLISYYDERSLKFARHVEGKWSTQVVEHLPPFGRWSWKSFRSSIVLDSKGHPHIGFESLRGLEHAWWNGQQWQVQLIVPTAGVIFFENSMTIDKDDVLYMTFKSFVDGSLKLAIGRPTSPGHTAAGKDQSTPSN